MLSVFRASHSCELERRQREKATACSNNLNPPRWFNKSRTASCHEPCRGAGVSGGRASSSAGGRVSGGVGPRQHRRWQLVLLKNCRNPSHDDKSSIYAQPGFAEMPGNQVTEPSLHNLAREWALCRSASSRSAGVRESVQRMRVRSTPSSL